jgi:hypothetical protein
VFTTELGERCDPTQCVACAQGAGLPSSVGLHTLRQSAASVMLSAGVPLKVVSEVFGHANVAMSMPVKLGKVGTGRPRGTAPMVWIPLLARSNNATHPPARIIAINGPGERGTPGDHEQHREYRGAPGESRRMDEMQMGYHRPQLMSD